MPESMFVHTIKPMQAQINSLRELGDNERAEGFQRVYNRVNSGHIKTLSQLHMELKKVNGNEE